MLSASEVSCKTASLRPSCLQAIVRDQVALGTQPPLSGPEGFCPAAWVGKGRKNSRVSQEYIGKQGG